MPLFDFHGPAGLLLAAYKFAGRRCLAPWFSGRLAAAIGERWPDGVLVPVPPRSAVFAERGWDHVELLARLLQADGFAVVRPLMRAHSLQQKSLGLEARKINASRAYHLKPGASVPKSAVLLDDVFTTGATADACARILKEAGTRQVFFAALAAD